MSQMTERTFASDETNEKNKDDQACSPFRALIFALQGVDTLTVEVTPVRPRLRLLVLDTLILTVGYVRRQKIKSFVQVLSRPHVNRFNA